MSAAISILALWFLCAAAVCARAQEGDGEKIPGKLTADYVSYDENGVLEASGGVIFESPNLLPDGALRITTDELSYDRATGLITADGTVVIEFVGSGAELRGEGLSFDTKAGRGELLNVKGSMPVDTEPDLDVPPGHLFIHHADMVFEVAGGKTRVTLSQAKLSTYPYDDTDMWFQLKKVEYISEERITMEKGSAYLSGFRIAYWPRYDYSFVKSPGLIKSVIPWIGFSNDDGLRVFWSPSVYLGDSITQVNLDWWTERGLLTETDTYFEFGEFDVGVQQGEVWALGRDRKTAIHKKRYNAYVDFGTQFPSGIIKKIDARAEYGRFKQETPDLTGDRFFGSGRVEFRRRPLGPRSYFATAAGFKYFAYGDLPEDELFIFNASAAVGRVTHDGTDKIEVRYNPRTGEQAFRFDDVSNELEFHGAKYFRINENWLAATRVLYDAEHGEWDRVSLEIRKLQKAYTLGVDWDFSTGTAALTMNVRFW